MLFQWCGYYICWRTTSRICLLSTIRLNGCVCVAGRLPWTWSWVTKWCRSPSMRSPSISPTLWASRRWQLSALPCRWAPASWLRSDLSPRCFTLCKRQRLLSNLSSNTRLAEANPWSLMCSTKLLYSHVVMADTLLERDGAETIGFVRIRLSVSTMTQTVKHFLGRQLLYKVSFVQVYLLPSRYRHKEVLNEADSPSLSYFSSLIVFLYSSICLSLSLSQRG